MGPQLSRAPCRNQGDQKVDDYYKNLIIAVKGGGYVDLRGLISYGEVKDVVNYDERVRSGSLNGRLKSRKVRVAAFWISSFILWKFC